MPKLKTKSTGHKFFLGIDPGKQGGFALISNHGKIINVYSMPATELDLLDLLRSIQTQYAPQHAILEKIQPAIFGIGKKQMSILYGNYVACRMAVLSSGIPCSEVDPKTWQKGIGIIKKPKEPSLKWKDRLRQRAQMLYPNFKWDDYNITTQRTFSDAVLIGNYYARNNGGSHV